MVCLADSEAERAWCRRKPDAPDGWEDRVSAGAGQDFSAAADLGGYMTDGSVPELEAYLEWLRQRVLGWTGRQLSEGETGEGASGDHPAAVRRIVDGDPQFWALVGTLADAVQDAGTLNWRQARVVLDEAKERTLGTITLRTETTA